MGRVKINKSADLRPLDSELLMAIESDFVRHEWKLDVFGEFFDILMQIVDEKEDRAFLDRVQVFFERYKFESIDEANIFVGIYTRLYNSTIALLESIEGAWGKKSVLRGLDGVAGAIIDSRYGDGESLQEAIYNESSVMVSFICDQAGVDPRKSGDIFGDIAGSLGESAAELLEYLITATDAVMADDPTKPDMVEAVKAIILSAVLLNMIRKENFKQNGHAGLRVETVGDTDDRVGRNDPCPCGSGKKYKKCCMEKTENPLSVLDPVEAPLKRLDKQAIRRFYEIYMGFMTFVHSEYAKRHPTIEDPIALVAPNGMKIFNPVFHENMHIADIQDYLIKKFDRIATAYIKNTVLADDVRGIIESWEKAVYKEFMVIETTGDGGAIFWEIEKNRLYYVYGLVDDISEIAMPLPAQIKTILLPYEGRIVYNGLIIRTAVEFGETIRKSQTEEYISLRRKGKVIMTL